MPEKEAAKELATHLNMIIRALLVAHRNGAPAEGRIPFNPLYFNILRLLDRPGGVRPSQIAERLQVPRTTVSTALKALEGRGLVKSSPDAADGRAIAISLTADGRDILQAILRQDHRNATAMLDALDEAERNRFVATVGKVAAGLARTEDP